MSQALIGCITGFARPQSVRLSVCTSVCWFGSKS